MTDNAYSFLVLKQVDSTNNYAMGKVHEGLAKNGDAVFSTIQTGGKGQRGKVWHTGDGENIALSIVLQPKQLGILQPFQLSAAVALGAFDFYSSYAGPETKIKWPNDIYWRDRKAGGILIENLMSGNNWKWSVAGVGLNVNQLKFGDGLNRAISLKEITGNNYDVVDLARKLHYHIMKRAFQLKDEGIGNMIAEYQQHLYGRNRTVRLKKNNMIFETTIKGVSPMGQLLTHDAFDKAYEYGEVEWIL